jgi:hypothetical protein
MSFWAKIDVEECGDVVVTTYGSNYCGDPCKPPLRSCTGSTASQALRSLAAAMVTAKAEIGEKK